jgi:ribosomal protein S12 methylthiotransferase accessory factor
MQHKLRIQHAPKVAPQFSERTVPTEETLSRARVAAAAKGVTRLADITGLDRIGIPVFTAVVPKSDDTISVYNGKGCSSLDARTGALMESIERQTALGTNIEVITGSYAQLRHNAVPAIDPELFNHRLYHDYDSHKPYKWTSGYDLIVGETVLVPASLGGFSPRFAGAGSPFVAYSTNGLASGNCIEEAVCHALCELVERDAWTLAELRSHWIPCARREAFPEMFVDSAVMDDCNAYSRIDLNTTPWPIDELVRKFERAGLRPVIRDISSDFGIACAIASVTDELIPGYPQAHSGLGAHPNARIAVVRALTELAQSRAVDIQAMREDILPADAVALEHQRYTQRLKSVNDERWMLRDQGAQRHFGDIASIDHEDVADDIALILSRLQKKGIQRAIVVDLTEPEGFPVVRVAVPGLEFWEMDNGKLGSRALQFWKQHALTA